MAPLGLDVVSQLPEPCRGCVTWELDPAAADRAARSGDPAFEKEAWLSSLLLSWGTAGRVAHVADELVGYVSVAPPVYVPRAATFPTSPVSADAVLLLAGRVVDAHRGAGIARMLVQGVAKDLTQRGVRALEAFALGRDAGRDPAGIPGGAPGGGPGAHCLLPQDLLEAVGFTVVREHPRFPRMRLELRSALAWREDVEAALEQLLGSLPAASPVLR